jgi:Methane oxygenase PmoA
MAAMRRAILFLLLAVLPAVAQVKITPGPEKISVEINGKPFTDFWVAGPEVAKPYLWPLRAASGTYVTRMWPMEKVEEEASIARPDHPHQRGLWFAHASVNGLDFWNIAPLDQPPYNRPDRGKIVLEKMGAVKSGKDQGSIAAVFDWNDHDGKTLLREARTMTFHADPTLRIVDFDITLTAVAKVQFGDEKDGVFGLRLRPVLQEDKGTGHISNADGGAGEKAVWGKPSNWCDYSGEINGEKVGIAVLDNPGNPAHPVRWHVRGYGLFAANPFGQKTFDKTMPEADVTLAPGQSLHYRYRMIIHPGDAQSAKIAEQWTKYAK